MPSEIPVSARYSRVAVVLHWVMALGLVSSLAVGLTMVELPFSPLRLKLYNWHKWGGIVLLALFAARLTWRLTHRPPVDVPMPGWQRQLAHAIHSLLYVLMAAIPLLGWAYSSAAGFPIVLFGVWPLPDWVAKDAALADALKPWHARLAWLLLGLAVLHIAGALKHHFIDRDGLLHRMR
jgi:cytochrome b561